MDTRYDITVLGSVDSTQDAAGARFPAGGRPVLVVTGDQTGGRGRSGRSWMQADRGVAASVAFAPAWDHEAWGLIPLATAVAVRAAILDVVGVATALKWPNDLLLGGGKVAGILAEASGGTVIVGCGINLFWNEPPDGAAALLPSDPGPDLGGVLAESWAGRLLDIVDGPPSDWPRDDYLAASLTVGAPVRWDGGEGVARDIDPGGGLIVDTPQRPVTLYSGEVHLLR